MENNHVMNHQPIITTDTHSLLERQNSADFEIKNQYTVFIGNPGVGKSTLLNSVMMSSHKENSSMITYDNNRRNFFKSGLSIGKGLTYELESKVIANRTYMDTPGLEDVHMRQKAAAAVTDALKKDGYYKVVFVVTLESGRLRTIDVATINLVLNNAPEISHFGVIFNKLSTNSMEKIQKEHGKDKLLSELFLQISRGVKRESDIEKPIPLALFLPLRESLEDNDDMVEEIPGLADFIQGLPPITIHKENVQNIPGNTLEEIVKRLEENYKELKSDANRLHEQMVKDKNALNLNIAYVIREEEKRHEKELQQLQYYYNYLIGLKEKDKETEAERVAKETAESTKQEISHKIQQQELKYQQQIQQTNDKVSKYHVQQQQKLQEVERRLESAQKEHEKWKQEVEGRESWISMFFRFILPW